MNPITWIYHELLFRPLFNLLVGITALLPNHSVGLAIILVTVITRLVLLPSSLHQARQLQANQQKMSSLKEELAAIAKRHKDNQAKKAEATMAVYRKAGINPASGCLPLLIQLPILIALYKVFLIGLTPDSFQHLYSFVTAPASLQLNFLGIDLGTPSLVLGIVAGVCQLIQMRFFNPTPPTPPGADSNSEQVMAAMQRNMTYIFPVMTVFIALRLPAALSLYWVVSTVWAIVQQLAIKRMLHLSTTLPAI